MDNGGYEEEMRKELLGYVRRVVKVLREVQYTGESDELTRPGLVEEVKGLRLEGLEILLRTGVGEGERTKDERFKDRRVEARRTGTSI